MLDQEIKSQLTQVFADLKSGVGLSYNESKHADHAELLEMLKSTAETSPHIQASSSGKVTEAPGFDILRDGKKTGVSFLGIPGGHEFTSFVLAILNAGGAGKMPDTSLARRIKTIKGPVRVRTFISLSCENCPDVVQAMNQMALLHDDFQHTMVDGAYAQDEIEKLGIQGVPAVIVDNKLVHSGKISFIDLVQKLESVFGTKPQALGENETAQDLGFYDVVVVGGGAAGISSAIYSARKGLKTALLAERLGGQIQDTKGIENMISVIYTEGPQLVAQMVQHLSSYQVAAFEHRRVRKIIKGNVKTIMLEGGEVLTTDQIIVATGAKWRELGVPGEKEYMGKGVAYCPHCDGPFYKDKKVAVIGGGNSGVEAALDLSGIVREVVLFEYQDSLKADAVLVNKLKSTPNISIVTSARTDEVVGNGQKVQSLKYTDRKTNTQQVTDLDGIFVQIGLIPNTQFLKNAVDLTQYGEIIVDNKGRTSEPGIYAAGDVTTVPYKQIVIAMGEGAKAALGAFEDRMKKVN